MNALTNKNIEDHLMAMRAESLAENTVNDRSRVLYRLAAAFADRDPITRQDITGWLAHPRWAAETRATYHGHAAGFFRWAFEDDRIETNPMAKMRRPKVTPGVPRPVTDDQLAAALRLANPRWKLIITLAAYAGLRASEIATLERGNVTVDELRIRGKGDKVRIVPTHPEIWKLVEPLPAGLVLLSQSGRPFLGDCLTVTARSMFDRMGMHDVTLHRFRHWFGTAIYQSTRDLLVTQQLLGHSTPAITQRYAQVDLPSKISAIAGLKKAA